MRKRGLEATASLNREVVGRADLDLVTELVVKRGRALADARTAVLVLLADETLKIVAVAGEVASGLLGREVPAAGTISLGILLLGPRPADLGRGRGPLLWALIRPAAAASLFRCAPGARRRRPRGFRPR